MELKYPRSKWPAESAEIHTYQPVSELLLLLLQQQESALENRLAPPRRAPQSWATRAFSVSPARPKGLSASPFLRLPAELRILVYNYVLIFDRLLRPCRDSEASDLGLLVVSKQIYSETRHLAYSQNTFHLTLRPYRVDNSDLYRITRLRNESITRLILTLEDKVDATRTGDNILMWNLLPYQIRLLPQRFFFMLQQLWLEGLVPVLEKS